MHAFAWRKKKKKKEEKKCAAVLALLCLEDNSQHCCACFVPALPRFGEIKASTAGPVKATESDWIVIGQRLESNPKAIGNDWKAFINDWKAI